MKKSTPVQWFFKQLISVGYIINHEERLLQERYLTALDMENNNLAVFLLWLMTKYTTTIKDGEFTFQDINGNQTSISEIIENYKKENV